MLNFYKNTPSNHSTSSSHSKITPHSKLPIIISTSLVACLSMAMVGCGDDNDDDHDKNEHNDNQVMLIDEPTMTKTFTATELKAAIDAAGFDMIKDPVCGITVHYMNHTTKGVADEATNATGAVITPNGDDEKCQGERPINLYAHGTNSDKNYNMAALDDPANPAYGKALYVAATYAGQGDILIAPNYPGYGESDLDYIPYNTAKQGEQMLDALAAGKMTVDKSNKASKKAVSETVTYNDKLFITGFSQGGYVTMATAKLLDEAGTPATAISPSSGAYAITAFGDAIMSGNVIAGGTIFLPMIGASYAKEYQNADGSSPFDEIYADKYKDAPSLFPTDGPVSNLFTMGKLPVSQLFQSNPTGYDALAPISPPNPMLSFGFDDNNYLFSTDYRAKYIADMQKHPDGLFPSFTDAKLPKDSENLVRQAFIENDLRHYEPSMPVLMCGGNQDPSVKFDVNTTNQARIWENKGNVTFALLDMDITNRDSREAEGKSPYVSTLPTLIDSEISTAAIELQADFASELDLLLTNSYQAAYGQAISSGASVAEAHAKGQVASYSALLYNYHGAVDSYCVSAANTFFEQYR